MALYLYTSVGFGIDLGEAGINFFLKKYFDVNQNLSKKMSLENHLENTGS